MKRLIPTLAVAALVALCAGVGMLTGAGAAASALPALTDMGALPAIAFGGLIVNRANLSIVFTGFNAAFQNGLGMAPSQWNLVGTRVPSTTSEEKYGWLGKIPGMREWLGARVHHNVAQHDYAVKNKDFEQTIDVGRNEIEDDQFGVYAPLFTAMGEATAAHPNELVFDLLKSGFDGSKGLAYDSQFFFDTDHPVIDENGAEISVANTDGGAGDPWFLMDSKGFLKPIIYQVRKDPSRLVRKDRDEDENVFEENTFTYGVHGRANVGFGFWQKTWGSKQTLNKANYEIAFNGLEGMKGDHGRPLGVMPDTLVVPPALRGAALEIVNAERDGAGATNVWKDTARLEVVPWLA